MRFVVGVLALLGVAGSSPALADPAPPDPAATPAAPAAAANASGSTPVQAAPSVNAAAPAAPAPQAATQAPATAAAAAAPAVDPREQRLLSQGYRPQMHEGQKLFCKRQPVSGSRTEVVMRCGTVEQLVGETQLSREATEQAQRIQLNTGGH
jgi:hypothetical protein